MIENFKSGVIILILYIIYVNRRGKIFVKIKSLNDEDIDGEIVFKLIFIIIEDFQFYFF